MTSDEKLLNQIYINSITAINAISKMLKKTNNPKLYDCLFEQIKCYRKIANTASKLLLEYDKLPIEKTSFFDSSALYVAVNIAGMGKISPHRLAKILISGSIEGIYDIVNYVNACTNAGQKSRFLAYSLISLEEKNINVMNEFL